MAGERKVASAGGSCGKNSAGAVLFLGKEALSLLQAGAYFGYLLPFILYFHLNKYFFKKIAFLLNAAPLFGVYKRVKGAERLRSLTLESEGMEKVTRSIEEWLFRYFAGQLDADEKKELLEWLEKDPAHRARLAATAERWALLHAPRFAENKQCNFETRFGFLRGKNNVWPAAQEKPGPGKLVKEKPADGKQVPEEQVREMQIVGMEVAEEQVREKTTAEGLTAITEKQGRLEQPGKRLPAGKGRFWMHPAFRVAAFFVAMLSVGLLAYQAGYGYRETQAPLAVTFEASTPLGSKSRLVLPDQTVVWLNAGSSLKCMNDVAAGGTPREVWLEGEAYFEVAPDSLRPFIVRSEKLRVRVTGTHFDVRAYPDEEIVDVALVSGKVYVCPDDSPVSSAAEPASSTRSVASARLAGSGAPANGRGRRGGNATAHKEVELAPERMLSYNKETNCVQLSEISGADVVAWTKGGLRFHNRSFARIAKDLERKFNVPIRVQSRSLAGEMFTGSFPEALSLDEILREIDVEHKYVWRREKGTVVIRDK